MERGQAEQKYQVGDLTFLKKKDCGPGNLCTYTLFGSASLDDGQLAHSYTGVLRLPLKAHCFSPELDDEAFNAYKRLAPLVNYNRPNGKMPADADSFIELMREKLPGTGVNSTDWTVSTGKLELMINSETIIRDGVGDANALKAENYVGSLKKNDVWEKYFYNTKPGENAENWFMASVAGPTVPGLIIGFGIGHTIGGSAPLYGLFGGLLGGFGIGLGVTYVSKKIRQALFNGNVVRHPQQLLNKIHFAIDSKKAERADFEAQAEAKKLQITELMKSKDNIKERDLSIKEYARATAKLNYELSNVNSELRTFEDKIKERLDSIKRLHFVAGKIFDRETYKPGLIVKFTSPSLKIVEDYFAPMLDLTDRSLVVMEAHERADKIVARVGEDFEKVKKLEENKATAKLAEGAKKAETLFGTYELLEKIGSGGFGEVHLVKNDKGDTLALKKPIDKESEKYFRKNEKTIDAILKLEHPNIVKVHHVEARSDTPYEVSEYIEGGDLEAKIIKAKMSTKEALKLLAGIAEGLAYAHSKELVHGDVKPKNILLTKDGVPKVADFDSARALDEEAIKLSMSLTKSVDKVIVTMEYSAPEVLRKKSPATKQSDVYSFGALAFRILAGVTKNEANKSLKEYRKDLPDDVISMVQKCLELNPQDRYQNMKEVVDVIGHEEAIRTTASMLAGFFDAPEPTEHDVKPVEKIVESGLGRPMPTKLPEHFKVELGPRIPTLTEKRETLLEE